MFKVSRIFFYSSFFQSLKSLFFTLFYTETNFFLTQLRNKITNNLFLTAQGRVGLYYIAKFLNERGFQKFYLSPYTNIDVVNALRHSKCSIVFVDIDIETGYPKDLESIISDNENSKCCILITHLYSNKKNIEDLCKKLDNRKDNIKVIEDAAIVFGSKLKNKFLGNLFDYGFFSFGLIKNLNTFFGGAILHNNDEEFQKYFEEIEKKNLRQFSKMFMLKKIIFALILKIGFNKIIYNLISIHVLKVAYINRDNFFYRFFYQQKFPKYEKKIPVNYYYKYPYFLDSIGLTNLNNQEIDRKMRFKVALNYYDNLKNLKNIKIPQIGVNDNDVNAYLEYPIILNNQNKYQLLKFLRTKNIFLRNHWYINLANFFDSKGDFPNANYLENHLITLPCHPEINKDYQDLIVKNIKDYFNKETN